jgi:hypothetical protein
MAWRSTRARCTALAGIMTAMAILTGCHSSGGSAGGLTRVQLDAQANAICKKANVASARIPEPDDIYDALDEESYFNLVLPVAIAATDQLMKLTPDSAVAADWKDFMTDREAGQALLQATTAKINAHNATAIPILQKQGPPLTAKIAAAAKKVGAVQCVP